LSDWTAGKGTTAMSVIGTALGGVATLGNGLLGLGLNNNNNYIDKDTLDLQLKLVSAEKDNAILAADLASEKKMVQVYNAANDKINAVRDELNTAIRAVDNKVDANAATQGVINAQVGSQLNINTSQIAQLFAMTKLVIPNSSVCYNAGNNGTTTA